MWRRSRPSSATAAAGRTTWHGTQKAAAWRAPRWLIYRTRDCLAPPYAVTEDMNGAKPPVKTCYRCKKDGHVRFQPICSCRSRLSSLCLLFFLLARGCRSPRTVPRAGSRSRRTARGARSRTTPGVMSRLLRTGPAPCTEPLGAGAIASYEETTLILLYSASIYVSVTRSLVVARERLSFFCLLLNEHT